MKTKIFLVDDDPLYLKTLKHQLQNGKYDIVTFENGEDCVKALSQKPQIIFLDYQLTTGDKKAMNGLATLKKIKNHNPKIQVVMLSAKDQLEIAVNCMKNEAFDYIVKNESAFMRASNTISNIFKHQETEKQMQFYKNTGISTVVFIIVLLITLGVLHLFFPDFIAKFF